MSNNPFEGSFEQNGQEAPGLGEAPQTNPNPFLGENAPAPPAVVSSSEPANSELAELKQLIAKQSMMIASLNERVIKNEMEATQARQALISSGTEVNLLGSEFSLEKAINQLGYAIAKANNPSSVIPMVTEPPDPDDYMEEPALFYAYRSFHIIADDTRRGVQVRVPGDTPLIQFKNVAYSRQPSGALAICRYECYSKRIAKWLREHSQFNVVFFEQGTVPIYAQGNSDYSTELSARAIMISKWPVGQIAAACAESGVPTSDDPAKMIAGLAAKMTEDLFVRHDNGTYERKSDYNNRVGMNLDAKGILTKNELKETPAS